MELLVWILIAGLVVWFVLIPALAALDSGSCAVRGGRQ